MAQLDIDDRIAAAELDIDRERASVEAKQSNLNLLNNYTKVKITKQLSAEIESARIAEQAAQSAFELENNKSKHLERQVKNCKLYAPNDGILVHANDPFRAAGRPFSRIEEGATVRERQKIFSLPELTKFRAVVTLPESVISQIRPGQAAQVQVDAFPNENLAGIVEVVFPLPDPPRASDSNGKYYTTYVLIEKGLPGLRPGMTSNVRIVVGTDDDVLSVPVSSVIRDRKNDHSPYVAVEKPDGTVEWRNVTLGRANGAAFEVKEGLKPGETIVIDPAPLWLWKEKEKAKGSPQPDATTKPAGKTPRSEGGGR
jgi:RND family efflux transporter MFP subunit